MKTTFSSSLSGAVRNALMVMAGITILMAFASPALATPIHFGVRCEDTFQSNWQATIDVEAACSDFISEISTIEPVDFYFNLHGAQTDFYYGDAGETCNACGGVDSVDFFYMSVHGGLATAENLGAIVNPAPNDNAKYAAYAMWDFDTVAWTAPMRIGSSGKQAKALVTFSCDTLYNADKLLPTRWGNAFAGGLKFLAGGHDLLYTGNDQSAMQDFATFMVGGSTIGSSWLNAVYNDNNSNHPAIANTGTNSSNCWSRQGVTLGGLMGETVLRDSKVGYYCWTNWN